MAEDEGTSKHSPRTSGPGTHIELNDILDLMTEGVVVLGPDLKPEVTNAAARELLGLRVGSLPPRLPSEELIGLATRAQEEESAQDELLTLFFPSSSTLKVRAVPLGGRILITLRDVTQEVLAQKVRKEFVSHASHELKSPVASLQALAEAIHQAMGDDPEAAARFSERLVMESDRLGRLVNDLLDLSRLEDAGATPTESICLPDVAQREIDLIRPAATDKGIELTANLGREVWIQGDDSQIGLLVRNLLENAIRYTAEGGHVAIEVDQDDTEITVTVSDDGIGIPRDAQSRVFERFYRIDRARSRDRGGTGLGLAIVKHVAELHGGRVDLVSDLGEGSTFTARFPRVLTDERIRSIAG
jgi:signal transduction histidine kinase